MIQTDLYSFSYKKGSLVPFCKKCGEQAFYRNGKNKQDIQRYKCKKCGFRFLFTSDLPRKRYFSNIISFAVELYTDVRKAISLRGIAELLKKIFNVKACYETIRKWVANCKDKISRRKNKKQTIWHADETFIKIKGRGYWLWIVYDRKGILSWAISRTRKKEIARKVFAEALRVSGVRPKRIITDGLKQYSYAIKKVIMWKWREQKEKHIVSSGVGKNAYIERLNKEIKRRINWFGSFQSLNSARVFFRLWFYHYNVRKSTHQC